MKVLMSIFENGGATMFVLLALSLAIWTLLVLRWLRLRREPLNGYELAQTAIESGREELETAPGVLAEILRRLFRERHVSRERIDALFLAGFDAIRGNHDYLSALIRIAPLLGLLGTVVGMMETFAAMQLLGTSEPGALSSGIAKALITTQAGLSIALAGTFGNAWIQKTQKQLEAGFERARLLVSQHLEVNA